MSILKRLLRRWLDVPTPEDGLAETLAITVRCARRCAYDYAHALDLIPASDAPHWRELHQRMRDKSTHWQSLFSSGTSVKDYRLRLHRELDERDTIINALRAELRALGHNGFGPDEMPF